MSLIYRNLIITFLTSIGIGCGATYLIASSQNGYVAGFIILPLFLFIGAVSIVLLIISLICLASKKDVAPWLLLAAVLIPASFISSALITKYLKIGAYHEEPIVSFSDETTNVVLFKEGTSIEQIEDFWNKTMSLERADGRGRDNLSGVRTIIRIQPQNGREAIAFGFFPNATEEQKQIVFAKVKSSPVFYQLLEK